MSKSITRKNYEVTIVGLTFIVDYRYYAGCPATYMQPADEPEVEVSNPRVVGQPDADAEELLEAIKVRLCRPVLPATPIKYTNGYDLIEQHILETHENF